MGGGERSEAWAGGEGRHGKSDTHRLGPWLLESLLNPVNEGHWQKNRIQSEVRKREYFLPFTFHLGQHLLQKLCVPGSCRCPQKDGSRKSSLASLSTDSEREAGLEEEGHAQEPFFKEKGAEMVLKGQEEQALSRRLQDPPRAPHSQPPLGALAPESPHGRCQSLRSCPAGASECAHFLPPRTCPARLERRPAGPPADVFLSPRGQREPAVPPGPKANRRAPHNWHPRQPCPRHARARVHRPPHPPPRVAPVLRSSTDAHTSPHTSRLARNRFNQHLPATHLPRNFLERAPVSAAASRRSSPLLLPRYAYLLFTTGRNSPVP
ncbi:unnamed protein product [Rangifer tarandus platyrhynchus]|uniref:Uncharacterized protein n=1 Tax=Rangifer tarandus platyrhynchus TaxID=3082113 RepID=A0AC59YLY7_RANTA